MTSRSRTRRHRSTPQIAPRTNFFPSLPSFLELARTTLTTRLSHSPAPLTSPLPRNLLLSSPCSNKSTRPGFQTADLFFHVAIYFFTPACTGWMRKESSKGEPTTTRLSHPYFSPFLPSSFSFFNFSSLLFFSSPSIPFECFLSSVEARWWMVIGIKLCRC